MILSDNEMLYKRLYRKLEKYGQEHLLAFYDGLSEYERTLLANDIENTDFELISKLYRDICTNGPGGVSAAGELSPLKGTDLSEMNGEYRQKLMQDGISELKEGRMAVLTMAGGQGTRLGHTGPKGTYDIGLPSHKSLFEIQCDGLKRVSEMAGRAVPWYIMTSHINNDETEAFFEKHNYFGYGKQNITFFKQEMMPAIDRQGKLLLENKYTILKSPNGNGGLFSSLLKAGGIEKMKRQGAVRVFVCGIDNCLVKMADPVFLGFVKSEGCAAAAKSFLKRTADEKAGVFCMRDGRPCVIEYTEIPERLAQLTDENGKWIYGDTNVLNYIFDLDTAERLASEGLSYHVAVKKLTYIDTDTGMRTEISNGYKFELFLFDVFAKLDTLGILRVESAEEFAPVKNKTGVDSAESARKMYISIYGPEA